MNIEYKNENTKSIYKVPDNGQRYKIISALREHYRTQGEKIINHQKKETQLTGKHSKNDIENLKNPFIVADNDKSWEVYGIDENFLQIETKDPLPEDFIIFKI